ncbi:MAG: hypothetical protein K9N48_08835 [Verrucomicrobia bacterium]|nr:hypothetical protein [Verrucomicrobiota bacterium]MCF7708533.1 hypothetical protein [Verrucomicrobiota bacterium]
MNWLFIVLTTFAQVGTQIGNDSGAAAPVAPMVATAPAGNQNPREGKFEMTNGNIYTGRLASANEEGIVIRLDVGGFSQRIPWVKLTQETLKKLAQVPEARNFAVPFIDIPIEVRLEEIQKKRQVSVREVPTLSKPMNSADFFGGITSPLGFFVLAILYAANIFASYQISRFRQRPTNLVCAVAAVAPVLAPVVFLSLPTRHEDYSDEEYVDEAAVEEAPMPPEQSPAPAGSSGLSIAKSEDEEKKKGEPQVFKRGETTFNRRFFETRFAGLFRIVPSESDKDMVLVIKTHKNEYVGKRISRISSNELHLQLLSGAPEVTVKFGEIAEVQFRHKDSLHSR